MNKERKEVNWNWKKKGLDYDILVLLMVRVRVSQNHSGKRTWAEVGSPAQGPLPNNFHLISSPINVHHGFFFNHKPPHQDIISQWFPPEYSSSTSTSLCAKPSRDQYCSFLLWLWVWVWVWERRTSTRSTRPTCCSGETVTSPRRIINLCSQQLIVWGHRCTKAYPCEGCGHLQRPAFS